jgi:hypothetical protein
MIWLKLDEPDVIEERCIMYIALDPQITILWYQQHQQQTNKQHLHSPATSLRAPPCICLKAFYSFHFSSLSSIICIWFECKRIRFLNLGFSNLHVLIWLIQFYKWRWIPVIVCFNVWWFESLDFIVNSGLTRNLLIRRDFLKSLANQNVSDR